MSNWNPDPRWPLHIVRLAEAIAAGDEAKAGQAFKRHVLNGRQRAVNAVGVDEPKAS